MGIGGSVFVSILACRTSGHDVARQILVVSRRCLFGLSRLQSSSRATDRMLRVVKWSIEGRICVVMCCAEPEQQGR